MNQGNHLYSETTPADEMRRCSECGQLGYADDLDEQGRCDLHSPIVKCSECREECESFVREGGKVFCVDCSKWMCGQSSEES